MDDAQSVPGGDLAPPLKKVRRLGVLHTHKRGQHRARLRDPRSRRLLRPSARESQPVFRVPLPPPAVHTGVRLVTLLFLVIGRFETCT